MTVVSSLVIACLCTVLISICTYTILRNKLIHYTWNVAPIRRVGAGKSAKKILKTIWNELFKISESPKAHKKQTIESPAKWLKQPTIFRLQCVCGEKVASIKRRIFIIEALHSHSISQKNKNRCAKTTNGIFTFCTRDSTATIEEKPHSQRITHF